MVIVPASGSSKRAIKLANVDFPAPDGPTSAVTVPAGMLRLTSSNAWMSS